MGVSNPRVTTRLKHEADGSGYMEPGYTHLFVMPVEGGSARQITSGDFHHNGPAQWSKDGKKLIFSANRHPDWEYDRRNSEIYSVSIEDGAIKTLTTRKGPDQDPVISPDGKWIAYLGYEDKIQTYQINELTVMNLDGSGKKTIKLGLDRNVSDLTWDAQGQGLYFQYDDKGNTKLGYASLNGTTTLIAKDLGGTTIGRPYGGGSYSISPSGTIAFTHTTPSHPAELAVITEGSAEPKLIAPLNEDLLPFRNLATVEEIWYKSSVDGRRYTRLDCQTT